MSFGYCDFSAQSHFQALSRENRYRASWISHSFQEKRFCSSSSSKSNPNTNRMTWSPAASTTTTIKTTAKSAEETASKRGTWAAVGSALNNRATWLPSSSSPSIPHDRSSSSFPDPNKRIPVPGITPDYNNKKDKSRRGSMMNGCLERVKSFGKKDRRDRKNYRKLDDASVRINLGSY